ncbi:putative toxin-antitoxin system toxin component, PIN family [Thiothrix unzii]|jgi:putative PIN family toxin of toxin-antitoxin system|uniref:putative toxin-antitoxin system toxin component, PIN family n=1 Tax=Thiothrix unzii TaxID=111769 RepID=UPI002A36E3F6|nr:putative toxin-antitoxin system toxin component, PIN family [Thiothrix unzii]MDX9990033.1 putative toxin-antitoxin system toxin component, PIN family [Thiothrix unzii]
MTTTQKRLVLDTNTLISAFTNEKSVSASFFRQVRHTHQLLASSDTVAELLRVIQKPKFDKKFIGREESRKRLIFEYIDLAAFPEITQISTDCRDPDDNIFLSIALSGGADFIISGDLDLRVLNPYHGVRILTIREYAEENGLIL